MKNKVLRLAIVAVLVVAMVLSMAACNDPKPDVTPTPTPVVTPTPTKTPDKTPDKTPTPTPVVPSAADDSALAKATYGIELKGEDFTYGKIVDANDATKKFSEVKVVFSKDLLQNFKPLKTADYVKWSVEYEGEGTVRNDNVAYTTSVDAVTGVPTLTFTAVAPVGVYTVHATVKVEDKGFYFGRFGAIKADTVTYELTKIINVNKADLTIKTPSFVAPVEELADGASKAPIAPEFTIKLTADVAGDDIVKTVTEGSKTSIYNANITALEALYANLVKAYGDGYAFYLRAASMIDTTKVGSYELLLSAHKLPSGVTNATYAAAKEENIVPFAEIPAINHNVTFETGKQYFVDAYDWNAIRDVATSILEINAVKGVDQLNKVKLARARYDALTDAQKAFFTTGVVATSAVTLDYLGQTTVGAFLCAATQTDATIELLVPGTLFTPVAPEGKGYTLAGSITTENTAKTIFGILTAAETTFKDEAVKTAWEKAVKDAKFVDYAKLTGDATNGFVINFNINNASAVAAYNTVKTYFDALSEADQAAIAAGFTWTDDATHGGTMTPAADKVYQKGEKVTSKDNYTKFFLVSGLFGEKAVKEVQTLIAAAAAAYNRAVLNANGKFIYTDALAENAADAAGGKPAIKKGDNAYGGVAFYLNNAEVVAVTNQANAAYEKLSDDQKAALATAVVDDANTTKIALNFDVDARNYDTLLGALVTMNKVVGYMEQVISHTNIEDLQHKNAKTPAYADLNKIVYGKFLNESSAITAGNYLTYVKGTDNRTTYNAVGDIIRAFNTDKASLDAVVAEYKAMIDYVLAAEAYKAEQIAALNALIATEFVAENHTEGEIAVATASTNPVLGAIVLGMTTEKDPKYTTKVGDTAASAEVVTAIVKSSVAKILNGNVESYDEAKAAFEGLYNLDKAMSVFVKTYANTVVAAYEGSETYTKMIFTYANKLA